MDDRWMPGIALRGLTVLPGSSNHFEISRKKSLKAAERAMMIGQKIFLVAQKDAGVEDPEFGDLEEIGTIARIRQLIKLPNNIVRVIAEGLVPAELIAIAPEETAYLQCLIREEEPEVPDEIEAGAMKQVLLDLADEFCAKLPKPDQRLKRESLEGCPIGVLLDRIAGILPISQEGRQEYLRQRTIADRYQFIGTTLSDEVKIQEIKQKFQDQVKTRIDENQRDYILREQLKVLHQELGDDSDSDADVYAEKLEKLAASDDVKEKIGKELKRFRKLPPGSQEASVSQMYLDTLFEMPWEVRTDEHIDLVEAQKILDADHYGLDKVKERILEYLAVRKLSGRKDAAVLCLVGPPGTGKTSIARSIARATNRKYVRICLGGVRDEAEIRGHRRTYVGSMPGRIASGLKEAGVKNPLMLLDEVDKVSSDYKGDVSSALLEVLDTEQNMHFRDHYLEPAIDLSEVLFIATANSKETIPAPLLDRMDVIDLSGYTENEKFHIADRYLVKKQMDRAGLTAKNFSVSAGALKKIIHSYTRETGVRSLERKIGEICRKAARTVLEAETPDVKVSVTVRNVGDFLGKPLPDMTEGRTESQVGIATGLAWTSVGGCTLEIEVNTLPGKGGMKLTGKLGDVMKESAQAALTYVRSIASEYGVDSGWFEEHEIHVHIPEGAVPKDGPSAGITLATALLSAVTGRKVRADVAMTGEITLRGRVLPIGGLKEKTLAAKQSGVKTLIIPVGNRPDAEEISAEITEGLTIVYAKSMTDVLETALI